MKRFEQYAYYLLIGIISFVSLAFLPMLTSSFDVGYELPKTKAAWLLWAGSRAAVSILNILIFHCFVKQGNVNTKNDPNRLEAEKILSIVTEEEEYKPKSPKEFLFGEYSKKVPSILFSTALSLVAFGEAILKFDPVTFLSYLFTVIMAIVWGILEMFKVEEYYKVEMLKYAKNHALELEKEKVEKEYDEIKKTQQNANKCATIDFNDIKYIGNSKK